MQYAVYANKDGKSKLITTEQGKDNIVAHMVSRKMVSLYNDGIVYTLHKIGD